MRNPFTKPVNAPHKIEIAIAHHSGMERIKIMVIIPDRLIIAPTEKSMPPQIMVNVTPNAMISRIAAELSMSKILYFV